MAGCTPINSKPLVSFAALTTRNIAYVLLALYGVALLFVGVTAALRGGDRVWIELFKSGFLILGGGLTSVIGYYFGSRGTQEAEAAVKEAEAKVGELRDMLRDVESQAPTVDEEVLIAPEQYSEEEDG
ncbi:MAG: hypothetical protein JSU63_03015 [Phycisphaerales bacterium]|nr:MAG: hypothetical protein JSU63_03015 [Phycisphaerales bacterium]